MVNAIRPNDALIPIRNDTERSVSVEKHSCFVSDSL